MTTDERGAPPAKKRLLIVMADLITPLLTKGEITQRYYNPCDVFDEVHFLLLNEDAPNLAALQSMVGRAKLHLHQLQLPPRFFFRSLGWNALLMKRLFAAAIDIARKVEPDLVRAYGPGLNGLFANKIGAALRKPVVVSLHNRPDHIIAEGKLDWLRQQAQARLAANVLQKADHVLSVYRAQKPYLAKLGVEAELIYNVIGDQIPPKQSYAASNPIRVVSVGRQLPGKNISRAIDALARLSDMDLTVIGDGPLHESLKELAVEKGVASRVHFTKAVNNSDLCRQLATFDIFVSHNEHPGIPKAVMEPMLAGIPVVMNRMDGQGTAELEGAAVLVENSEDGYWQALRDLGASIELRKEVGESCRNRALDLWEPVKSEALQADYLKRVMR